MCTVLPLMPLELQLKLEGVLAGTVVGLNWADTLHACCGTIGFTVSEAVFEHVWPLVPTPEIMQFVFDGA
jgi:hypothetical protein